MRAANQPVQAQHNEQQSGVAKSVHTARMVAMTWAILGAVLFSGKAIIAKLLYQQGADAVLAVCLRMLFSGPFFLLLAWWGGRGQPPLSWQQWRQVTVIGFTGYYLANVLDFLGLQYISASLERLILYIYPTLVLLFGLARGQAAVRRSQWVALGLSYLGVLWAFGAEAHLGSAQLNGVTLWGAGLVFGSATAYAIYLVLSGELVRSLGAVRLTGLASSIACLLGIAQFLYLRPVHDLWVSHRVLELSVVNAIVCTVLPMWMIMRSIELSGSSITAQIGLIGPLSTLLMSVWILGEPFTPAMAGGTGLVLLGIAWLARAK